MSEKTTKKPSWLTAGEDNDNAADLKQGPLGEGSGRDEPEESRVDTQHTTDAPDESSSRPRTLSDQQTTQLSSPPKTGAKDGQNDGFIKKVLSRPSSFTAAESAGSTTGASATDAGTQGSLGKSLREWFARALPTPRSRLVALMATLLVLGLFLLLHGLGGGSSSDTSNASAPPAAPSAKASPSAPADSKVVDTGITFGDLSTKGGKASLSGAGLTWDGSVTSGESGQTITLKGPTAVQIRQGFEMPRSSIQSGVFAVAQQGGDVLHVVFNMFQAGDTEITQGSIFAVKDDKLVYSGYYRDERKTASDTVIRTYMPPGGRNYRRSFKAPKGTPIPLLVGFKGVDTSGGGS